MSMLGGGASALTSPPARIHLSSSTKMSLHDRFTKLAKNRTEAGLNDSKSSSSALNQSSASTKTLGSAKNRRLALQMANRPSVQAALKIKKRSIRQRLGGVSALAARTGGRVSGNNRRLPAVKRLNQTKSPGKSPLKSRLGTTNSPGARIDPSRLSFNNRPGGKAQLALRLGGNAGRIRTKQVYVNSNRMKQRVTFNQNNNNNNNRGPNNRNNNNRNNNRRNGGGNRRNGNRPNGKGAAVGGDPTKVKQNLDMDLAQYMAKSKSHLDADLDVYMAHSSTTN